MKRPLSKRKFGNLVLEENQYVTWVTVDYPGYTEESRRLLQAINAQWGFFPMSIESVAPEGLAEVHSRMHCSTTLPVLVTIDKHGGKTFEFIKGDRSKPDKGKKVRRRKTRA